jgi:serine/threonine protein kinase
MAEDSIGKMNGAPDADIAVFTEALRLPAEERDHYLSKACKGDAERRRRVEALLQAYEQAGDFLGKPAADRPPKAAQAFPAGENPGDRIGHYKLLQQIGEGGCGVVYMAEQEEPVRRRVALKIIKPGMDTKNVIARFEAERQALALMNHPNIAKVFDAGATEAGRPYFVMELVRGVKITEYCNQHSLTTEDRLGLFVQACQAVQHAHQRGIIHRDIKPSNILVTQSLEGVAMPMVIDFGVAKATTDQRLTDKTVFTAFEMLIGTPAYMSPEQATLSSVDVDTRTDIYSLGVLLYELLTSSTPFEAEELLKAGLDEIRRVIREQEPLRPSTRLSKMAEADLTTVAQQRQSEPPRLVHVVRGDLDWIAMKALEKDRTRRYETANGLALDVKRFLENEPVLARPPSRLYKFQKTVQRNKLLFLGVSLIAGLLIVSLILVSASLAKERQSRLEAKQVKQFLEAMLQGVEPEVARGRDTTILREILDRAAARIDKETNQPAVAAELRSVIGTVYERTAQYSQAEEMQRTALAICRERFGRESPEAAAALNELGITLIASGKKLEAEQVCRAALEIRRRRFGNENADAATSEDNLAHACSDNGKFTEAEALIREALATRRKLFGEESTEVVDSLRNQVLILGNTGKWAEAEATAREVLALRRKLFGPQAPSVSGALYDLAWAAAGNGKQNEAEALEREALALRQKVLTDNYSDIAESVYHLGDRMRQQGNLKDAYSALSAALSLFRKSLGDDHPYTLHTLNNLGLVCEADTNWSESETVFRQVLASWRKQAGDNDPKTLQAMRNLAGALEGQGKWAEAETLHREALASWRKRARNEDLGSVWEVGQLTRDLEMQKKFGEAKKVLDETLTPAFANKAASADLQFVRVGLMGRQGRWMEAEADINLYIAAKPDNHYGYHMLAALLAITRNQPAYNQLCQKILPMFAGTTDCYIAERVSDDCLLLPDSGADVQAVDKLADIAVACTNDANTIPYFQACKALSEYRQGQFSEAVVWAEKSLKTDQAFAQAKGCAVMAMADWRLGKKTEARTLLAKGNALAPRISSAQDTVDLGDSWVAWLFARITLNEAFALIQPASPTERNSNNP